MNNNLEFENEGPAPNNIEDNHPRTNYGEGYYEEPKQETLEEFIEREGYPKGVAQEIWEDGVRLGAKWQAERMYSEEDVINALHSVELKDNKDYSKIYTGMKEWFEQFKKIQDGKLKIK